MSIHNDDYAALDRQCDEFANRFKVGAIDLQTSAYVMGKKHGLADGVDIRGGLLAALLKFGRHPLNCATTQNSRNACDCGLNDIIAKAQGES